MFVTNIYKKVVLLCCFAWFSQATSSLVIDGWSVHQESIDAQASPHDRYGKATVQGDFNGDGYDDLVVGIPWMEFLTKKNAGAIQVLYGSKYIINNGLLEQLIFDLPDNSNTIQEDALFGSTLASGDLNGDGYDDLIVGVPNFSGTQNKAGAITVIYGSLQGLELTSMYRFSSDTPLVPGYDEPGDSFGHSLAVGDFDSDGFDDVAIGHPLEDNFANGVNNSIINGGAITILQGSFQGISGLGSRSYSQHSLSAGIPENYDMFGWSLASGDFNSDGYDDLIIGVPYEDYEEIRDTGSVIELKGGENGISSQNYEVYFQGKLGMVGVSETGDAFGFALTTGDFNGDGYDDAMIGIPYEDKSRANSGAITFMNGDIDGLSRESSYGFSNSTLPGDTLNNKKLGFTAKTGDFNSDGYDDVVIAAPGDDVSTGADTLYKQAGSLVILFGKEGNVNPNLADYLDNIFPQTGEWFGSSLAIGNFNGGGSLDIAIGAPRSTKYGDETGQVVIFYFK